jgi:hypothetical protein
MITLRIAGHNFADGKCTECGCYWHDIWHLTSANVGETGWTHDDKKLEGYQAAEVVEAKQKQDKRFNVI